MRNVKALQTKKKTNNFLSNLCRRTNQNAINAITILQIVD